jgi:hypothetical protein
MSPHLILLDLITLNITTDDDDDDDDDVIAADVPLLL